MKWIARALVALIGLSFASAASAAYSPATTNGWFIFVGRVAGAQGSLFRTDLWLFNPDSNASDPPVSVTLIFHPQVSSGGSALPPAMSSTISLAARETRYFPDVTLATVPAGDGEVGSLEWQSSAILMGGARVYTAGGGGTFGFFVPAIPITESLTAKQSSSDSVNVLQIFGMNSGDANFRVNCDATNTSDVTLPIEVKVVEPTTAEVLFAQSYSVAPHSLLRMGNVLKGLPLLDGLRVTVAVQEGTVIASGGVIASVTTLDNRTNDGFAFVGQRQSATIVPAEMLPQGSF
jgi:hypothetical protein